MGFDKKAPDWKAEGIEPPLSKREIGWEVEDKPPAAWLNWYMNTASESIQELQTKAAEKAYVDEQISEAIEGIEVDVPDASLTQKGVAMLEDSIVSTSITKAATPNSVKVVNDSLAAHKADDMSHVYYADDTGTANAKIVVINPVPTIYKKGLGISFTNKVLNTGAVTINVNGLGVKAILKSNGSPMVSGNLKANSIYTARYNGTAFILQGEGGDYGTAIASQVRAGTTIGTEAGIVAGTLAVQATGAQTITPTGSNIVKAAGIYDGDITIAGVVVPVAKVLNDTSIAGQAGTMPNSTQNLTPQTYNVAIPAGYHTGAGVVLGYVPGKKVYRGIYTCPSTENNDVYPSFNVNFGFDWAMCAVYKKGVHLNHYIRDPDAFNITSGQSYTGSLFSPTVAGITLTLSNSSYSPSYNVVLVAYAR